MNDAIRLNNEAIELLSRSSDETHVQEGIILFTTSLRALKAILVNQETNKGNDDDGRSSSEHSSSSQPLGRSLAASIDSPCVSQQPQCPGTDDSNYVYKRMFRLFPTKRGTHGQTAAPNAIQIYISCVIFNIAFLHQHQASLLEPGMVRASLLEKSALLYKACFQILLNVSSNTNNNGERRSSATSDDVTFLLKVGALNNSAQILYECDQFEQASSRLEMVESILCDQGLSETQCCFTAQEFEGILANVLLLKPPTVAVAA